MALLLRSSAFLFGAADFFLRASGLLEAAVALAAGDLGGEGVELVVPEPAEAGEPGVDGLEGGGVDGVEAARAVDADAGEAAVAQDAEVLRDGGLGDAELGL